MTWFKVDDGFYDHPKLVGVSMASRGLWVTAGSYCSRHLTDGVISWRQIRALGGTKAQVRGLLDAGLWRAIGERSGSESFAFHDWIESQPTKSSVLDARERERNKKAKWREAKSKKAADQQEEGNVHGGQVGHGDRGQNRPSTVSRPDPTRPDLSIEVGKGSADPARATGRPSDRCTAHVGVENPPACGGCAQARRDLEAWQAEKRRADIEAEREHRATQADAERAAINDCDLCDTRGYRNRRVCNHDPTEDDRRRRGLAEARSILAEKGIA
ncbi:MULTISPECIES: hypothetical protein [Gordonia]|uniref:Uncharacterized protein n=1 Tax=Gordonia sihwensis NBRC 108236 TaxID=1223544 RepID=L7LKR7_9ACTN|nr:MULTISPECIES: hypothetical protein [Gordonia]GAC60628.1 hypothetical protein GSI01S_10_02210 [Gordonia sihwensis NBRC 108236]